MKHIGYDVNARIRIRERVRNPPEDQFQLKLRKDILCDALNRLPGQPGLNETNLEGAFDLEASLRLVARRGPIQAGSLSTPGSPETLRPTSGRRP